MSVDAPAARRKLSDVRFMEIPATAPDVAFSREIFARALSRTAPQGPLDAWLALPTTQDAATEIKAAIRAYASAAMAAAVADGYVPHATGFLDPLLADPLDEGTISRVIRERATAGYPLRKISRGPAMVSLQAAIQKIKDLMPVDDEFPCFNHAEYVMDFSNRDRAEWDVVAGPTCASLRKAMLKIPFGSNLFQPIPPDTPKFPDGSYVGFLITRPGPGKEVTGIRTEDAKTLQWEKAWRKSAFTAKLTKVIHPELVPYLFAPLGHAEVSHFRAELAAIQTIRWRLTLHDESMLASMTWPSREDAPAWQQMEVESMRVILVTEAIGSRAQGAPRPMSMLPSDYNVLTAKNTAEIFAWAKRSMKSRRATMDGEEVPVIFARTYLQVKGSWLACCYGDEIDRLGSLSTVLSDTYRRNNLERVNAEKIVDAWAFVVPPLRTDGSLLDRHAAAIRFASSHPDMPAVTATDLADAFQNTTVPEYRGWTEDSGIPFGNLLSPSDHVFPDENTPVGQAQLRVAEGLGADVRRLTEAEQPSDEDEERHRANKLQIAAGMGLSVGQLLEMGLLQYDTPDSDVVPESVSSKNPDSQGGSQPPRSDDQDMLSVHSSDMPDGDTHIHTDEGVWDHTDEDMPGLQESSSSHHTPTPETSQPSTPRANKEDQIFSATFERIAAQQAKPQTQTPLAPPFRTEVDATAMMDELIDNSKPMFGDDYRRALGELQIALGFDEEMMILHLTDWQMLKELLVGSTVSADAQVLLLAAWRHRREFVLSIMKAMDERQLKMSITWIEPLPPLTPIEPTVQPSQVDPRSMAARPVRGQAYRKEGLARKAEPEVRSIFQTRRAPEGPTPASGNKVLSFQMV